MPKCQLNGKIGLRNMDRPTDKQIADVLAGLASAEEAKRVAQWFATDAGSAYLSEAFDLDMKSIRPGDEDLYVPHAIPSEEVWRRIKKQIRRYRVRRMLFRVAAVVLPFVLLLGLYYQVDSRVELFGDTGYEEIYVPKGERLQMMFQDGTKVYLNSDTRLRYPKKFGLDSREVELSGEAYFVVSKNEKRPFMVLRLMYRAIRMKKRLRCLWTRVESTCNWFQTKKFRYCLVSRLFMIKSTMRAGYCAVKIWNTCRCGNKTSLHLKIRLCRKCW